MVLLQYKCFYLLNYRYVGQTPEEHDAESEVRSKESRKYVISRLDDLVQVTYWTHDRLTIVYHALRIVFLSLDLVCGTVYLQIYDL